MAVSKTITFTDTSTAGNGETLVAWLWEFYDQDGTTLLGTRHEQNTEFTFPAYGQYWVRLTVTNSCGAENSTKLTCVSTGCPTPSASFTHTGEPCGREPPCDSYGDVDDDGLVTFNDLDLVETYSEGGGWDAVKDRTPLDETEFRRRADVNGDGSIDLADRIEIHYYIAGQSDTFPVCS